MSQLKKLQKQKIFSVKSYSDADSRRHKKVTAGHSCKVSLAFPFSNEFDQRGINSWVDVRSKVRRTKRPPDVGIKADGCWSITRTNFPLGLVVSAVWPVKSRQMSIKVAQNDSIKKWKISTSLQKLPINMDDLGKIIITTGFAQSAINRQSGHTGCLSVFADGLNASSIVSTLSFWSYRLSPDLRCFGVFDYIFWPKNYFL